MTTKLPAAPYADDVLARPRYMARPHLPILNSAAVSAAPLHTLRHGIFTSGRNLNIAANSTVSMPTENRRSTACPIQTGSESARPIAPHAFGAAAGFRFDLPDGVERALQLAEQSAGAEEQGGGAEDGRDDRSAVMPRRRHHRVDDAGGLLADHAAERLLDLMAHGLLAEDEAGHADDHEKEWREREDGVVRHRRAELHDFVLGEVVERAPENRDGFHGSTGGYSRPGA